MKNLIKTLIAAGLVLGTTLVSNASNTNHNHAVTVVKEIKKFNKLNVAGNVQVFLVQSTENSVKVYDNYYANNALVQEENGELRITSFQKEPLTVIVNANRLSAIKASDNAQIRTSGKFNTIALSIALSNKATATITTETLDLYVNLSGESKLTLSGTAEEYNVEMSQQASIKTQNMITANANLSVKNTASIANVAKVSELPELYF